MTTGPTVNTPGVTSELAVNTTCGMVAANAIAAGVAVADVPPDGTCNGRRRWAAGPCAINASD
jgi:hypothetical protein